MLQDLRNRLPINPKLARRLSSAHTINMAGTTHPTVKLHRIHPRPLLNRIRRQNGGLLIRYDGQIIQTVSVVPYRSVILNARKLCLRYS